MAKGRMLNKKISNSKAVNSLPLGAELLYTWLIAHLDVNGCFYGDAKMVNHLVFPRKNFSDRQIESWLKMLEQTKNSGSHPLIYRYKVCNNTPNNSSLGNWGSSKPLSDASRVQTSNEVDDEDTLLWMPGFDGEQSGLRKDKEKTEFKTPPNSPTFDGKSPEKVRQLDEKSPEDGRINDGVITTEQEQKVNRIRTEQEGELEEEGKDESSCSCCSENDRLSPQEISEVAKAFEENVCKLTSGIAVELNDALESYSKSELLNAIKACALQNKHTMAYFLGVLRNKSGGNYDKGPPKYKIDPDKYIRGRYGHLVQR